MRTAKNGRHKGGETTARRNSENSRGGYSVRKNSNDGNIRYTFCNDEEHGRKKKELLDTLTWMLRKEIDVR